MKRFLAIIISIISIFVFVQCSDDVKLNNEKELLSFSVPNNASNVTINDEGNVTVQVYEFVDITKLVPVITVSTNAAVYPESGATVDFTNPVDYTITAQDGSEAMFTVTVIKELSHRNEIISFVLDGTEQIFERDWGGGITFLYMSPMKPMLQTSKLTL